MLPHLLSSLAGRVSLTPRRGLVLGLALAPALLAAVLVGAFVYLAPGGRSPGPPPPPAGGAAAPGGNAQAGTSLPPPSGLLVDVTGAVVHPGVYRVASGERASMAIAAAGGLTTDADPTRLPNMAARLKDGEQINVPTRSTPARSSGSGTTRVAAVSLNVATAEQLATVPGFTPDLVAAVIQYRTDFGGFTTTRELVDVLLMSEADYQVARRYVTA
jgi:DNA uptake protein ComE-like DNA-binding protein